MCEERDTTAYKLFNNLYQIAIPARYLYDERTVETTGILATTLHDDLEQNANYDLNNRKICWISMAELCAMAQSNYNTVEGCEFVKGQRASHAYDTVNQHLLAWRDYICGGNINQVTPPLQDLKDLDEMAKWLYSKAFYWLARTKPEDKTINLSPDVIKFIKRYHGGFAKEQLTELAIQNGHLSNVDLQHEEVFADVHVDDYDQITQEYQYGTDELGISLEFTQPY